MTKSTKSIKRPRAKPKQWNGEPLSPAQEALYWTMNDPKASTEVRMQAAMILAPIMHRPLPVQYVTMAEADALLEEALGKR